MHADAGEGIGAEPHKLVRGAGDRKRLRRMPAVAGNAKDRPAKGGLSSAEKFRRGPRQSE
jgi:hypothetical protein